MKFIFFLNEIDSMLNIFRDRIVRPHTFLEWRSHVHADGLLQLPEMGPQIQKSARHQ